MKTPLSLDEQLHYLKLHFIRQNHQALASQAAEQQWTHQEFLRQIIQGEVHHRGDQSSRRRIKAARFPYIKTLADFDWNWPQSINQAQVRHLFELDFIDQGFNVVFLGGVGLGKSHLAIALAHQACLQGCRVRFTSAIDLINHLHQLKGAAFDRQLKKYIRPAILVCDEIGFMPIDQTGSDILFQIISKRYDQHRSTIFTSNLVFSEWQSIFHNDAIATSAILDRILHRCHTIEIKGSSFRSRQEPLPKKDA